MLLCFVHRLGADDLLTNWATNLELEYGLEEGNQITKTMKKPTNMQDYKSSKHEIIGRQGIV